MIWWYVSNHCLHYDSYYQLFQLHTFVCSLAPDATLHLSTHSLHPNWKTAAHSIYADLPVGQLQCLDPVLCSAARLSGLIPKFGHSSSWLPLPQRISFRIMALVWRSCWASLRLIFKISAAPPWVFRATALSALLNRMFLSSLLLSLKLSRIASSHWLDGLSLAPCMFPRVLFYSLCSPETVLFSRAGIGSAAE